MVRLARFRAQQTGKEANPAATCARASLGPNIINERLKLDLRFYFAASFRGRVCFTSTACTMQAEIRKRLFSYDFNCTGLFFPNLFFVSADVTLTLNDTFQPTSSLLRGFVSSNPLPRDAP